MRILRYWLKVISRSWSEVWKLLDMKGRIINLSLALLVAILLFIRNNQSSFLTNAQNELVILWWIVILFMPALTFINLFIVPAKMHDELGGFDELKLRLETECKPPRYSEAWVSLRIYNDHPLKPIKSCIAKLISVTSEENNAPSIKRSNEKLAWSSHNPPLYGEKDIPPNENRLTDVVCTIHAENRIMFTIQEANDLYKDKAFSGKYLVVISVTGIFGGKRFQKEKTLSIIYSGDMNLSCEEINH